MTHPRQPPDESSDPDPEQPGLGTLAAATAGWERAERALDETERRYQHLVEHSLGLICTHDLNGTLLSVNPAAVRALAFEPGEGVGRNLRDFLSPDTRHLFDDY